MWLLCLGTGVTAGLGERDQLHSGISCARRLAELNCWVVGDLGVVASPLFSPFPFFPLKLSCSLAFSFHARSPTICLCPCQQEKREREREERIHLFGKETHSGAANGCIKGKGRRRGGGWRRRHRGGGGTAREKRACAVTRLETICQIVKFVSNE